MKRTFLFITLSFILYTNIVWADTFGTGGNQFTIDFVDITSATNPTIYYGFVDYDYRMGKFEITNDQWNKFVNIYGIPTGTGGGPLNAYDEDPYWTGDDVPTNNASWYEAAQFVNWLNTSTNHQAAYKFTGTKGTSNYTFAVWESSDAGYDASNPFRNSNAYYFLPTDNEWIKAAYWNGTILQTYATTGDSVPVAGVNTNYDDAVGLPWTFDSGSEELNETFNMMGNVWEFTESPYYSGDYMAYTDRSVHGGSYSEVAIYLRSSDRINVNPDYEACFIGFRIASVIPEPCTVLLLGLGGMLIRKR